MKKYKYLLGILFLIIFSAISMGCKSTPNMIANENPTIESSGTGFFVTNDGYVVTNAHVVEGANTIGVWVGGNGYRAELVAINNETDVAILKINHQPSNFFRIANFGTAQRGDRIFVLGYPLTRILGSEIVLTDGIINSFRRQDFHHSATVQPGNSGSPVFNERFEVLGVVYAKIDPEIATNINLAVNNTYILSLLPKEARTIGGNVRNMRDAERATVQITIDDIFDGPPVNIVNNTGYDITRIYISPNAHSIWGNNRLQRAQILGNNVSYILNLTFPLSYGTRYDFKMVDVNGNTYTKMNVTVGANSRIVFTMNDIVRSSFSDLSGTYVYGSNASITFNGNNYILKVNDSTYQGSYSMSGSSSFTLTGHNSSVNWIRAPWMIESDNTLRDADGDLWRKEITPSSAASLPTGTYTYGSDASITFSGNNYTLRLVNNIFQGTFSVSDNRFILNGHGSRTNWINGTWTIVDANTIKDADNDLWRKQATSNAATLTGSYLYGDYIMITFSGSNITVRIFNETYYGTYIISGNTFILTGHGYTANWINGTWTIVNDYTLRDADGDIWNRR